MRFLVTLGSGTLDDPCALACLARGHLFFVCLENLGLLRKARSQGKPYPKLYQSGVRYKLEPYRKRYQELATIPRVLARGWGDCKHLVAWRIAEEWERLLPPDKGPPLNFWAPSAGLPMPLIYWRTDETGKTQIFHAELRHPSGRREDPSRYLGM